jgi:hypothetical protein
MQPRTAVGADGRQEPKPDAELLQQPTASVCQVRPGVGELGPGQHRSTLWQEPQRSQVAGGQFNAPRELVYKAFTDPDQLAT